MWGLKFYLSNKNEQITLNQLKGKITDLSRVDQFSKVSLTVENQILHAIVINVNAINPNLLVGQTVNILFKETDVTLSIEPLKQISIDNQIPVVVKEIQKGILLSRIKVTFQNTLIKTVVPTEFANKIAIRMPVTMLIRSNELMLME